MATSVGKGFACSLYGIMPLIPRVYYQYMLMR